MRLVSLNICHGGRGRCARILDWLAARDLDFILLAEWQTDIRFHQVRAGLDALGYFTRAEARDSSSNGLLVASRLPFSAERITPGDATKGELLSVRTDNGLTTICGYFPQPALGKQRPFFDACVRHSLENTGPLLLIGDFNNGRNDVDVELGGTNFPHEDAFLKLKSEANLVDIWRHTNGPDAREWTYRSGKDKGFRIDHAFGNETLLNSTWSPRCSYDHSTREEGLADHSALMVEFES